MAASLGVAVGFRPRSTPLVPAAVAARGEAAVAVARRLLRRTDEDLAKLAGVAAPGLLLVVGAAEDLPWADGVLYLGRDPAAPSLLIPTTFEPDVPVALLERGLLQMHRRLAVPLALLLDPVAVVGVGSARPIVRGRIAAFAGAAAPGSTP